MANFVLPDEPDDVTHLDVDKRRQETQEWLRQRQLEPFEDSPPIVPELPKA
jgi:hypothetical protein